MTVVETPLFLRKAATLLDEEMRSDLVVYLGANPEGGSIIPETGGVRKLRWVAAGKGKRGGSRVIYYFHNQTIPLFLLTIYGKNQKANLTNEERNELDADSAAREDLRPEQERMKKRGPSKKKEAASRIGQEIIASLNEAIAWARGENVPVRITEVKLPTTDIRAVRRKLHLSQSQFAAKFGFHTATLKNWEQGRTKPDGPARVLLAVIAHHPEAVEDAIRKAG